MHPAGEATRTPSAFPFLPRPYPAIPVEEACGIDNKDGKDKPQLCGFNWAGLRMYVCRYGREKEGICTCQVVGFGEGKKISKAFDMGFNRLG